MVSPNLAARLRFFSSSAASRTRPDFLTLAEAAPAAGAAVAEAFAGVDDDLAAGSTIPKRACRLLNTSAGIYADHDLVSKGETYVSTKCCVPMM